MGHTSVNDEPQEGSERGPERFREDTPAPGRATGRSMIDVGLLLEYMPNVYRFARRLTRDDHAAEDLTQDTMLKAMGAARTLRGADQLRIWLFRVAVNLWRDDQRRRKHPAGNPGALESTPEAAARSSEGPGHGGHGDVLGDADDVRRIFRAMDILPDKQREVLYLATREGLSHRHIGEVLGVSAEAVKATLSIARKRMREQLADLVPGARNAPT